MTDAEERLVKKAKEITQLYNQEGRGCDATIELYNEVGINYEKYATIVVYKGPGRIAKTSRQLFGNRLDVRILDVGAGTGYVGVELAKVGYKNIDAVDASETFVEIAKSKGVYTNIFHQFVGMGQPLPTEKDTYDLVVMCGVVAENHLPLAAFNELIRIVKPGGYIVNMIREETLTVPWYGEGLDPYMQQLQKDGLWEEVSRTKFPEYAEDIPGLELVHRVL